MYHVNVLKLAYILMVLIVDIIKEYHTQKPYPTIIVLWHVNLQDLEQKVIEYEHL